MIKHFIFKILRIREAHKRTDFQFCQIRQAWNRFLILWNTLLTFSAASVISLSVKSPYSEFFWSTFQTRTRKTPNKDSFHAIGYSKTIKNQITTLLLVLLNFKYPLSMQGLISDNFNGFYHHCWFVVCWFVIRSAYHTM